MNEDERQQFEELEEERNGAYATEDLAIQEENESADEEEEEAEEQDPFIRQFSEAEERRRQGIRPRINIVEGTIMVLVALTFDGMQFLFDLILIGIVLNFIIDMIAYGTFWFWLKTKGIRFGYPANWGAIKRAGGGESLLKNPLFIITCAFGIELIPFLNALPAWTLAIVVTILVEYAAYALAKTGLAKAT